MSLKDRLTNATGNAIGTALSFNANRQADDADAKLAALKLANETEHVRPDPETDFGQKVLMARATRSDLSSAVAKRKKN